MTLYIDKDAPFLALRPEILSDNSRVYNIYVRGGETLAFDSEGKAIQAFELMAAGVKLSMNETLVL